MALDLVTKAEYKAYAGIKSTTSDTIIDNIIPKVSALVKSICRTTFVDYFDVSKTEVFKTAVNGKLILKESPLVQVQSVQFSEDFGANYIDLVEYVDYVIDDELPAIEIIASQYLDYIKVKAFKVTYMAGYEFLPEDLKLAIMDLITYYIRNDAGIHNHKVPGGGGSVQIEYVSGTTLPPHIRRVLDQHTAYYG